VNWLALWDVVKVRTAWIESHDTHPEWERRVIATGQAVLKWGDAGDDLAALLNREPGNLVRELLSAEALGDDLAEALGI
jgi:hypothetical protein